MPESILEPDLAIIDPHHHLWDLRPLLGAFPTPRHPFLDTLAGAAYYTFDHLNADISSGHNVIGTVFMECGAFYNAARPDGYSSAGEVEFVNGVAAQFASGLYGPARGCAAIIGHADLTHGGKAGEVLDALARAGNGRFRGIRHQGAWDADPNVLGPPFHAPEGLYRDTKFRGGFAQLGARDLTFDAWVLEPQIADVTDLARAFPDQPIVLDHCGTPLGVGPYAGSLSARYPIWKAAIEELAQCENVSIKLGGLAMAFCAMPEDGPAAGHNSEYLAELWRPYIETCIAAFGTKRAMFESNYPVDRWGASYATLWNAFKRITAGYSADEKADLYAGNAARFYRIEDLLS